MKRIIVFSLIVLLVSSCSTTKFIKSYTDKGNYNTPIQEYTIEKNGNKFITKLKISGKIVDINGNPIKNKNIGILIDGIEKYSENIFSDEFGFFTLSVEKIYRKSHASSTYLDYIKKLSDTINLFFVNDLKTLQNNYDLGQDVSLISPIDIKYSIDKNNYITTSQSIPKITNKKITEDNVSVSSRDHIVLNVDLNVSTGNIITLNEKIFSSESIRKIIQQEKETEEKRIKKERIAEENKLKQLKSIRINLRNMNLKPSDQEKIFEALSYAYDSSVYSILYMKINSPIYFQRIQILQVISNKELLLNFGKTVYGKIMNTCRKRTYYDGQIVKIAGVLTDAYSYRNVSGSVSTVPKIEIYAIDSPDW